MTDNRPTWEALVSKARQETALSLDVSPAVVERISRTSTLTTSDWPTWSAAGLSIAAAVMMMLTVIQTGVSWNDPLGDWFSSLFMVMS